MGKEEVKLSLFADDMNLNIENPKDSTKKLLELMKEFSKIAGYKTKIQNSVAFQFTKNKLSKKTTTPFTVASKTIKYLGINLTKGVKELSTENY